VSAFGENDVETASARQVTHANVGRRVGRLLEQELPIELREL
jgi:hypothetical protein